MKSKLISGLICGIALAMVLSTGVIVQAGAATGAVKRGGVVNVGLSNILWSNLDPATDTVEATHTEIMDAIYGELFEQGPGGKGIFVAVTTGNDVYALDETTGAVVWHVNVGSSPTATGVACGNISPLGILSTPVIDPTPGPDGYGTLYVAGAIGTTNVPASEPSFTFGWMASRVN